MSGTARREGATLIIERPGRPEYRADFAREMTGPWRFERGGATIEFPPNDVWPARIERYDARGLIWRHLIIVDSAMRIGPDEQSIVSREGAVARLPAPVRWLWSTSQGEFIVTDSVGETVGRNLFRFDRDGSIRWQIGPREFRPADQITSIALPISDPITVLASHNGWSGNVDMTTGAFLEVIATNVR